MAQQKSNIVYYIPCGSCLNVYVGQAPHLLKICIAEHKTAVKIVVYITDRINN